MTELEVTELCLYEGRPGFCWPYDGPTFIDGEDEVEAEVVKAGPALTWPAPREIPDDWNPDWLRKTLVDRLDCFTQEDINQVFREIGL